jgi:hypothetical protein
MKQGDSATAIISQSRFVVPLDVTIIVLLRKKCIQSFGGETSEKVDFGKNKDIGDNIVSYQGFP